MYAPQHQVKFLVRVNLPGNKPVSDSLYSQKHTHTHTPTHTHTHPHPHTHTLVVKHAHGAIALVVGHAGPVGTVDGELQVVCSQPVSMCVWVREETTLHSGMMGEKQDIAL